MSRNEFDSDHGERIVIEEFPMGIGIDLYRDGALLGAANFEIEEARALGARLVELTDNDNNEEDNVSFEIGDKVRVLDVHDPITVYGVETGDIGVIRAIDTFHNELDVTFTRKAEDPHGPEGDEFDQYICSEQVERVAHEFAVGDTVVLVDNEVTLADVGSHGEVVGLDGPLGSIDVRFPGVGDQYVLPRHIVPITAEEASEEPALKVGDKVEIIGYHDTIDGRHGIVTDVDDALGFITVEALPGEDELPTLFTPEELVLVEDQVVVDRVPKIGDRVRLNQLTGEHDSAEGVLVNLPKELGGNATYFEARMDDPSIHVIGNSYLLDRDEFDVIDSNVSDEELDELSAHRFALAIALADDPDLQGVLLHVGVGFARDNSPGTRAALRALLGA